MSSIPSDSQPDSIAASQSPRHDVWGPLGPVLKFLGSLRFTVVLFAFSILLIFVGTLAQVELNMWQVMEKYFRSFYTWMELKVLFPATFVPTWNRDNIVGTIPIPGGASLGIGLGINLLAAHLYRFKVQAKGQRLLWGLAIMAIGCVYIFMVVAAGHSANGLKNDPLLSWGTFWTIIRFGLCACWIASVVVLLSMERRPMTRFISVIAISALLGILSVYVVARGDTVRLGDSSLRILWQLTLGLIGGLILLGGGILIFKKRGGIVVIHLAVALLMFGELLVSKTAVEEQISMSEGEVVDFARDTRVVELAIIDSSPEGHDNVTVIPGSRLISSELRNTAISDAQLPFDVQVEEFLQNAALRPPKPDDKNPATMGIGLKLLADPVRSSGGAEADQAIDISAAYITIRHKSKEDPPHTYLVSQHFGDADVLLRSRPKPIPETITANGKEYQLVLRARRNYKPYSLKLEDVIKDDYIGTDTPRDYSSWVQLTDKVTGVTRDRIRIWMNNPLRYAGETFYQSGYAKNDNGTETSTLQVVTNTGWMIPYVACMVALVGMIFHFSQTLIRFLMRIDEPSAIPTQALPEQGVLLPPKLQTTPAFNAAYVIVPALFLVMGLLYVGSKARTKTVEYRGMNLENFAKIPVAFGGRVKPIGTLARNTLRRISDKPYLLSPKYDGNGDVKGWNKKEAAVGWLLDVITNDEQMNSHRIVRIESMEVQATLGVPDKRKRFRFSIDELAGGVLKLEQQAIEARQIASKDKSKLTPYQGKVLETDSRLRTYMNIQRAFSPIEFPQIPMGEADLKNPAKLKEARIAITKWNQNNKRLLEMGLPLAIPNAEGEKNWVPFSYAVGEAMISRTEVDPRLKKWTEIIVAYKDKDARAFNRHVAAYLNLLKEFPPEEYDPDKVKFESFFNSFDPFSTAYFLYFLAGMMTLVGWLVFGEVLRRSSLTLISIAFIVHTVALVARIYISGRPPVTNLYSSAVFIGWACVAMGIILEFIWHLSIGNLLAAVIGGATLIIADKLAMPGDTFTVLRAVLDTQFWLATHVVCITFGYSATFAAGFLGIMYIFGGAFIKDRETGRFLAKLVYGTVCFALLLSFIGTVLGGLWADDSWGRFWGWDPKENGALMIVLWNALILHARWGKIVADRGLAALAVFGNVVTAWSWFGVNELGVGLHSYGFTEGVLYSLGIFVITQLVVLTLAFVPGLQWNKSTRKTVAADVVS